MTMWHDWVTLPEVQFFLHWWFVLIPISVLLGWLQTR